MDNKTIELRARAGKRALARGVTLVEGVIVVAIMAVVSGAVAFGVLPKLKESRIRTAMTDARTIRKAAEFYLATYNSDKCPTVQDLVSSKQLDAANTDDPWGKPYRIACNEGEVRVFSSG